MIMNMKRMRHLVPLLLVVAVSGWGGTFTLSFDQHAAGNLFQTRDTVSDRISSFSLAFDHDLGSFSLQAGAGYSAFHETPGLDSFNAVLGLDSLVPSGSRSAFYFSLAGTGSFYKGDYAGFSEIGADLAGAFKTYITPSSILRLQWQGRYVTFADRLFDFAAQTASASLDKYFPSRTTLKAEAEYGYKYFVHPFVQETDGYTAAAMFSSAMGYGGRGMPEGYGQSDGAGWGNRRYQGGNGFVPRTGSGGQGIGHASLSLTAAQGIGDVVGLSVSFVRQWIVSGENPFASIEEFYLVANPSSDSFSWDGSQVTGRLTVNLPLDIELKAGYTYSDKTYPGVESLDLEGLPLGIVRNDTRSLVEARLEKDFRRFAVFAAWSHIDNHSTDPLFEWKGSAVTAGFRWTIQAARKGGVS